MITSIRRTELRRAIVLVAALTASWGAAAPVPYALHDVRPGPGDSRVGVGPASVAVLGRAVLFAADDGVRGLELWRADGSDGGTSLVMDVNPGPAGSAPSEMITLANAVLFRVVIDGEVALWRSDGTPAGTMEVRRFGRLDEGREVVPLISNGLRALMVANGDDGGLEPWASDGTFAGTVRLGDIRPGPEGSHPGPRRDVAAVGGAFYFTAVDETSARGLWRTDATIAGTKRVAPAVLGATPSRLVGVAAHLQFRMDVGDDVELWTSNGTTSGTVRVRTFGSTVGGALLDGLSNADDELVFVAREAGGASQVWRSDGTPGGTRALASTTWPDGAASAFAASELAGRLLYTRHDGPSGAALWSSDGEPLLTALAPSEPVELSHVGDRVYVSASDEGGPALWRTDGTVAGTVLLQRFAAAPNGFSDVGGPLLFFADDGVSGEEPWIVPRCGDGVTAVGEQCDDGNGIGGDGCAICRLEEQTSGSTGWLTTDVPADGATPEDTLETTVTGGGELAILETADDAPLAGIRRVAVVSRVTGTPTTITAPLAATFRLDGSVLDGPASDLAVLRDGVRVPPCTTTGGVAEPDPCVSASVEMPDGDVEVDLLASSGGVWAFGRAGCSTRPVPDCTDPASAKLTSAYEDGEAHLAWRWRGPSTDTLADPARHDHAVCLYDGTGPDAALAFESVVPRAATCGGASCWKHAKGGMRFVDRGGGYGGVRLLKLTKSGRVTLKVKGPVPESFAALQVPLTVQLQTNGGSCWQGAYSLAGSGVPVPGRLRARADPCAGCVVDRNQDGHTVLACVGDSNTDPDGPSIGAPKWCQLVAAAEPSWNVREVALYSTTALSRGRYFPFHGRTLLAAALETQPPPDVVVIALGANDLLAGASGLQLRDALAELVAQTRGAATWVTLVTPDYATPTPARVIVGNSMLGEFRTIDFFSGLTASHMCADGLHVCASGQMLMAERALAALRR